MPVYLKPDRRPGGGRGLHGSAQFRACEPLLNSAYGRLRDLVKLMDRGRRLHWTQADAERHRDVARKRCIHGVPVNVYCARCEP